MIFGIQIQQYTFKEVEELLLQAQEELESSTLILRPELTNIIHTLNNQTQKIPDELTRLMQETQAKQKKLTEYLDKTICVEQIVDKETYFGPYTTATIICPALASKGGETTISRTYARTAAITPNTFVRGPKFSSLKEGIDDALNILGRETFVVTLDEEAFPEEFPFARTIVPIVQAKYQKFLEQ